MRSPYVTETKDEVIIIGSAEALKALGEMMMDKARIGVNYSATFSDGENKPIRIRLDTDFLGKSE